MKLDSYSALIGSDILFFKPGNNRQTLLDALVVADEYLQLKCLTVSGIFTSEPGSDAPHMEVLLLAQSNEQNQLVV